MRVCLISREYPPETADGGIGTQTYLKAHALAANGHQVYVISGSVDTRRREYLDGMVRVVRVPAPCAQMPVNTEAIDWLTHSIAVAAEIANLHSAAALDLLDFPEWGAEGYAYLLNRTEWDRIPSVIHLHGPLVMFAHAIGWPPLDSEYCRTGTAMEGTCLRLADAVFSSSACSADWCARHYGLDRGRIPILHTGVDTQVFSPGPESGDERPTIIFVGRISAEKGVPALVSAACRIAAECPALRLIVVGRGDPTLIADLRDEALAAGFPQLLEFPGFVDRSDLPGLLTRAHVFAGPSVYEPGPGLVYLEAMACGLPVVACNTAGATEVVFQDCNGLLVPPGDVDALAEALACVLRDDSRRQDLGRRARQFVLDTADSRQCLGRIEGFYQSVLENAHDSPRVRL